MKNKILTIAIILILTAPATSAFYTNTSNYVQSVIITSGGDTSTSANYKNTIASGRITGNTTSPRYHNFLGLFYTLLLADGEVCSAASECIGGYCCSNSCSSSKCPVAEAPAAPAGPGGGAVPFIPIEELKKEFKISKNLFKIGLVEEETKEEKLKITNSGEAELSFSLTVNDITDFLELSDTGFTLKADEAKEITLNINGIRFGMFTGTILIVADGLSKSIPVMLEIESKMALFDVKLDIPKEYETIKQGEDLKAQITLFNIIGGKVDVIVNYIIKDLRGNVVSEESETFAVEDQSSYVKEFRIPSSLKPDSYVAVIEVRYANSYAVSSEMFELEKEVMLSPAEARYRLVSVMLIIVSALLVFILIRWYKLRKKKR